MTIKASFTHKDLDGVIETIRDLVLGFDCDNGVPELTYNGTYTLISIFMGRESVRKFVQGIEGTNGTYYTNDGQALWDRVYGSME